MLRIQRSDERYRGGEPDAGVDTRHAFSFSGFYDPDNLRFGALTACNEERLAPGAGFAEHAHRDLEIVTWVVEGELTHRDSTGQATVVRPGDLQRLTAGAGARHTERNDGSVPLRFVQMWLVPDRPGGEPEYDVVRAVADGARYALPRTAAALRPWRLPVGDRAPVPETERAYLHVVRGAVWLAGPATPGVLLTAGDAARLEEPRGMTATGATEPAGAGGGATEPAGTAGTAAPVAATVTGGDADRGAGAELLVWELGTPSGTAG